MSQNLKIPDRETRKRHAQMWQETFTQMDEVIAQFDKIIVEIEWCKQQSDPRSR